MIELSKLTDELARNKLVRSLLALAQGTALGILLDNLDIIMPTIFERHLGNKAYAGELFLAKEGKEYGISVDDKKENGKRLYTVDVEVKTPNTLYSHIDDLVLMIKSNANFDLKGIYYNTSKISEWKAYPIKFSEWQFVAYEGMQWLVPGVEKVGDAIEKIKKFSKKFSPIEGDATYKEFLRDSRVISADIDNLMGKIAPLAIFGQKEIIDGIRFVVEADSISDKTAFLISAYFSQPTFGTKIADGYYCLVLVEKEQLISLVGDYGIISAEDRERLAELKNDGSKQALTKGKTEVKDQFIISTPPESVIRKTIEQFFRYAKENNQKGLLGILDKEAREDGYWKEGGWKEDYYLKADPQILLVGVEIPSGIEPDKPIVLDTPVVAIRLRYYNPNTKKEYDKICEILLSNQNGRLFVNRIVGDDFFSEKHLNYLKESPKYNAEKRGEELAEYKILYTKGAIRNLELIMDQYEMDNGRYPTGTNAEIMGALKKYLRNPQKGELKDIWGNPLVFISPGKHNAVDIYSRGPNGRDEKGSGDDINNWSNNPH